MHELGLSESIVDAALRRAAGRRVTGLRVRIGGHVVAPEVVTQGIRLAAAGTVLEDATVDLVLEPMMVSCRECGGSEAVSDHLALVACPRCGGVDIEITGDEHVVLESITVAQPD